ncbi:hypothetical protein [Sphingomonas paeninsulae]|uniref:hypothetical protein n=1 Tax=Sphingomonas paeninsulae TaxID=2319844 RepID=UPI001EF09AB0|nr:hypothetical protein [Sphingomonas paeninsulae]
MCHPFAGHDFRAHAGPGKTVCSALLLLAVTATGITSPMSLLLERGWRTSVPVIAATLVSFGLALTAALVLI